MGGYGSGWQSESKTTVEDCLVLSLARLMKDKTIRPGGHYYLAVGWSNSTSSEKTSSIGLELKLEATSGTAHLRYKRTRDNECVEEPVPLTTTALPWGGYRWWFTCPLVVSGRYCVRRVGKLYLPPGARYFGCRRCYDLTYTSCQESHKYDRLYRDLGKPAGLSAAQVKQMMEQRYR
jgi:hypothetical protein